MSHTSPCKLTSTYYLWLIILQLKSHLQETAGPDLQTTAVRVLEHHACHLLMGNASKVNHNRLHFLCACSLQTSKPAGYSSSVAGRKWERQIRECQINADWRQWEAQNMWLHSVKLSDYFFPAFYENIWSPCSTVILDINAGVKVSDILLDKLRDKCIARWKKDRGLVCWCKQFKKACINLRIWNVLRINSVGEKLQLLKVWTHEDIFFLT